MYSTTSGKTALITNRKLCILTYISELFSKQDNIVYDKT